MVFIGINERWDISRTVTDGKLHLFCQKSIHKPKHRKENKDLSLTFHDLKVHFLKHGPSTYKPKELVM